MFPGNPYNEVSTGTLGHHPAGARQPTAPRSPREVTGWERGNRSLEGSRCGGTSFLRAESRPRAAHTPRAVLPVALRGGRGPCCPHPPHAEHRARLHLTTGQGRDGRGPPAPARAAWSPQAARAGGLGSGAEAAGLRPSAAADNLISPLRGRWIPAFDRSPRRFRHLERPIVASGNKRPAPSARQAANPAARFPTCRAPGRTTLTNPSRNVLWSRPRPVTEAVPLAAAPSRPPAHFLPDAVTCAVLCPAAAGQWRRRIRRANGRRRLMRPAPAAVAAGSGSQRPPSRSAMERGPQAGRRRRRARGPTSPQ